MLDSSAVLARKQATFSLSQFLTCGKVIAKPNQVIEVGVRGAEGKNANLRVAEKEDLPLIEAEPKATCS